MFIPTGFGEVTLRWRAATTTRDSTCVIGFQNDTSDAPATIATAFNNFLTATGALAQTAGFSSTYAWRGVRVVVERGSGPEIAEVTANTTGTLVADPIPPNGAFLVRKNTLFGGRRGRGRMFLPPIYASETTVDSIGTISAATITNVQNRVNLMLSDAAAAGYDLYLLHAVSEVAPHAISAMPVQAVIATQRRRLRR